MQQWIHLLPVSDDLFYSRNDPNDVRFGDIVKRDLHEYDQAQVAILGCPQDEGVRRNRGRAGASRAPAEIRRAFYRYPVSEVHDRLTLMDMGDIRSGKTLEEIHERLLETMEKLLTDGKKVVALGGGNDISYPDCRALARQCQRPLVFNIDRHLDLRSDTPRNSGTPYRQLLEEGVILPSRFHEVGINTFANSTHYIEYARQTGVHIHILGELQEKGAGSTIRSIVQESDADGLFFGFDLDAVRAIEAPGVSDPGPMGLTAREICEIADVAATDPRTRIIELTEVNPEYDRDGITSKLAANIIVRALAQKASPTDAGGRESP